MIQVKSSLNLGNISIRRSKSGRKKVLFIDEAHMLDIECFFFLNCVLNNDLAPLIVTASHPVLPKIHGTQYKLPHGLPVDFLGRVLILPQSACLDFDERSSEWRGRC